MYLLLVEPDAWAADGISCPGLPAGQFAKHAGPPRLDSLSGGGERSAFREIMSTKITNAKNFCMQNVISCSRHYPQIANFLSLRAVYEL
jgi:hypothetical protein